MDPHCSHLLSTGGPLAAGYLLLHIYRQTMSDYIHVNHYIHLSPLLHTCEMTIVHTQSERNRELTHTVIWTPWNEDTSIHTTLYAAMFVYFSWHPTNHFLLFNGDLIREVSPYVIVNFNLRTSIFKPLSHGLQVVALTAWAGIHHCPLTA